jgi:hypothetical protein
MKHYWNTTIAQVEGAPDGKWRNSAPARPRLTKPAALPGSAAFSWTEPAPEIVRLRASGRSGAKVRHWPRPTGQPD